MNQRIISILAVFLSLAVSLYAQESKYGEKTFAGLELRPLGPALTARFLSNSATQLPSNSATQQLSSQPSLVARDPRGFDAICRAELRDCFGEVVAHCAFRQIERRRDLGRRPSVA